RREGQLHPGARGVETAYFLAVGSAVEADAIVGEAARGQGFAIGGKRQRSDAGVMVTCNGSFHIRCGLPERLWGRPTQAPQAEEAGAFAVGLPYLSKDLSAADGEESAVGRKGEAEQQVRGELQLSEILSGGRVPQTHLAVRYQVRGHVNGCHQPAV